MRLSRWAITATCALSFLVCLHAQAETEAATDPTAATPASTGSSAQTQSEQASANQIVRSSEPALRPGEIRITGVGNDSALNIAILLTFLTLIPSILLCITPFARLLVVFHFLRQALGLQTTPSNQTLIGLSLILTFFVMQPVGATIVHDSVEPFQAGKISAIRALTRAESPVHDFMLRYVREKDLALFVDLTKEPRPHDAKDISMRVLVPAYIISELRAGFEIGAMLFLPFLIIDMVVASITTSIGMFQLPPVVISTPVKLLLFVMVDGWNLVIGSLMKNFA